MASIRVLHVDDEPDVREVVEISLGLDPVLSVRSCASGGDALAATADWSPDLIMLDVMMPDMDGPMTLARLREQPQTADVPVVFITACAQASEIERFLSLGAAAVIAKPFDPMTLAALVRRYAPAAEARIGNLSNAFLLRARADARVLAGLRDSIGGNHDSSTARRRVEAIARKLAEAASGYGLHRLSTAAEALEDAMVAHVAGASTVHLRRALDKLLARIESEPVRIADA
jgi:CheY-like chemotaxis protein